MVSLNRVCLISIDQPFMEPNGLVDVSPTESLLASVAINSIKNELESVLLTGEVCWRIVPFMNSPAKGRIIIVIKKNGVQIYKKICDLFVPEDSSCGRTSCEFTCLDKVSSSAVLNYELTVMGISDNVDSFRVTGPVNLTAMGLRKICMQGT